jgi:GNAT superfamily N-acetyltransferase
MVEGYSVGLAEPEQLEFLAEIEREAAQLFVDWNVPASVLEESTPIEEFREAQRSGHLWVALSPDRHPVGFALVEEFEGTCHLEELDVYPKHGRKGVGSALVRAVCGWASQRGLAAVTLTTYRDVPWNAPLYARIGFRILGPEELTDALESRVGAEAERGLEPALRVVMQFDLKATRS